MCKLSSHSCYIRFQVKHKHFRQNMIFEHKNCVIKKLRSLNLKFQHSFLLLQPNFVRNQQNMTFVAQNIAFSKTLFLNLKDGIIIVTSKFRSQTLLLSIKSNKKKVILKLKGSTIYRQLKSSFCQSFIHAEQEFNFQTNP